MLVAATRSGLRDAGHEPWDAKDDIVGRRRAFVRDPLGNLVELVEIQG